MIRKIWKDESIWSKRAKYRSKEIEDSIRYLHSWQGKNNNYKNAWENNSGKKDGKMATRKRLNKTATTRKEVIEKGTRTYHLIEKWERKKLTNQEEQESPKRTLMTGKMKQLRLMWKQIHVLKTGSATDWDIKGMKVSIKRYQTGDWLK